MGVESPHLPAHRRMQAPLTGHPDGGQGWAPETVAPAAPPASLCPGRAAWATPAALPQLACPATEQTLGQQVPLLPS